MSPVKSIFILLSAMLHVVATAQHSGRDQAPVFNIGTKWTYETLETPFPLVMDYVTFEIRDTAFFEGKKVFVIENESGTFVEWMHVDSTQVYFWDDPTQAFQLTYDFDNINSYLSYWKDVTGQPDSGFATLYVDSISHITVDNDQIGIQHISIANSGTTDDELPIDVLINIGRSYGGLRLPLGCGLCDFNKNLTKLRCFENDSVNYNFVGYPCDSTWLSLSAYFPEAREISVFPNPANGKITIGGIEKDMPYQLISHQGQLIQSGITEDNSLEIPIGGVYFLRLISGNSSHIEKVCVIR